jgi:putative ABC transport system substrate-binding protein
LTTLPVIRTGKNIGFHYGSTVAYPLPYTGAAMNTTVFWLLAVWFFAFLSLAEAQQPAKVPRIGFLALASRSSISLRVEAFRQSLRELGYVEGKNIVVEYRYADEKRDRPSKLAAELVRLKVDVILSAGDIVTGVVKEVTSTIPIVMAQDTDPVGNGFVASLAHPGGNITGLSALSLELSGKRLELLKEIFPRVFHVAVFGTSATPVTARELRETELAAGALGVQLQYLDVPDLKDVEIAFQAANKGRPDAVITLSSAVLISHRKQLIEFAARNRLPAMFNAKEFVEDGGLISYSTKISDLYRRAATYVDKILKGANPADLPVEQATKFELVINLKTAKQIGLTIPPNVLARADKVIR